MAWGREAPGIQDWLTRLQRNDVKFTSLTILAARKVSESDMIKLFDTIRVNCVLREFSSGRAVSLGELTALAAMRGVHETLQSLSFGDVTLGDAGLAHLASCWTRMWLASVDLGNKGFTPGAAPSLAILLGKEHRLRELHLGRNAIGDEGIIAVCRALQQSPGQLELLDLGSFQTIEIPRAHQGFTSSVNHLSLSIPPSVLPV